jgi:agmatinase
MYNVLEKIPQVIQLTQVGIRDFCEEEIHTTQKHKQRVRTFFDQTLVDQKHKGRTWDQISQDIVMPLPKEIWISFDIDGLDPRFCPNTGTPVPGGLDFYEVTAIFELLVRSGRRIIGFDLCEVTPDLKYPENEWDANVGARLLYQLAAWTLASQGKVELLQHSTPEVIQKGNEGKTPQPKK